MPDNTGHWRWMADPVWHYLSSTQFEAFQAKTALNQFMRYHHLRSCIYFAVSTIEAFLNKEMRAFLKTKGTTEPAINKKLRYTKLDEKRTLWPKEITGQTVEIPPLAIKTFEYYKEIRNEITHPKRRDHSIYLELDSADPDLLAGAVAETMVAIWEAKNEVFQYWALGWNYVGLNNDAAYPCQVNNTNGFAHSFRTMGFSAPYPEWDWEKKAMFGLENYRAMKKSLDTYPYDIEPFQPRFPLKPRLTRRWWDARFIYDDIKNAKVRADS